MSGLDVRLLQLAISRQGDDILAAGIYRQTSRRLVAVFQNRVALPATGAADAATFA